MRRKLILLPCIGYFQRVIYWTYAADREEKEASERDEEQGGTA